MFDYKKNYRPLISRALKCSKSMSHSHLEGSCKRLVSEHRPRVVAALCQETPYHHSSLLHCKQGGGKVVVDVSRKNNFT
jgi:hypothetical protein